MEYIVYGMHKELIFTSDGKNSLRPRKNSCLFPVTVRKNRVGRSVKYLFLDNIFVQKCLYYACFMLIGSWRGRKNFRVGNFYLSKNLLG